MRMKQNVLLIAKTGKDFFFSIILIQLNKRLKHIFIFVFVFKLNLFQNKKKLNTQVCDKVKILIFFLVNVKKKFMKI